MFMGPVFRAELIRTSRRRRYYVLRAAYGCALLFLIWVNYVALTESLHRRGGEPLIEDVTEFAFNKFLTFAVVQLATLLILVPALFGGVIADEKQRQTLHYLMASQLSSAEIVVDKLAARLLHVGVFVLLGLPVICLLGLFGGVAWDYVLVAATGTLSSTFFAAALALCVSTFARRVRQAVLIAYLLEVGWLIVPPLADPFCRVLFPGVYVWFGPVNAWVQASSPLYFWLLMLESTWRGPWFGGPTGLADPFFWMVGLQLAAGFAFLVLAIVQLRPTFRRQQSSARWVNWFGVKQRVPRWLRRPGCGDDAMLWKERHFARTDVFTKLVVLPATILLSVALILAGALDENVGRCLMDLVRAGYPVRSFAAEGLNQSLRLISPWYIGLWLLAVAGASASAVSVEREEDTWISLIATPLSGWEILRGKAIGAVWGLRGFGGLISLFWLLGLVTGAVHPLGILLALGLIGLLTWFVAALGVYSSLTARSTGRALTSVIVLLILLNGGYLVLLYPAVYAIFGDPDTWWDYMELVCPPYVAAQALLSFEDVRVLRDGGLLRQPRMTQVTYVAAIMTGYAVAAALLTWRAVRRFDVVSDRPQPERRLPANKTRMEGVRPFRSERGE